MGESKKKREEEGGERYNTPAGFKEVTAKGDYSLLLDINNNINPSTELWLIHCPHHHALDLKDGQQISLKLHGEGLLGSFQGSSGKSYDLVSFPSQNSNATIFLPSSDGQPKIAGKISRHVSLVHYPEPIELQKQNEKQKQKSGKSVTSSSHHMTTSTQSAKPRSSKSTSTHSTKHRSSLSEAKETPKPKKRKHMEEQTRLTGQSTQDSGRGHSAVTSS